MTEQEARHLAEQYLQDQLNTRGQVNFSYRYLESRIVRNKWSVLFTVTDESGHELDGAVIFIVDPDTGAVEVLPTL